MDKKPSSGKKIIMPVGKDAKLYKMRHGQRGTAVLLNHEKFDMGLGLNPRTGTNVDRENLKETLEWLDFQVLVHNDLTMEGVDKVIDEVSQQDHSDSDCLLVACLSHEKQGNLYARDTSYEPDKLWSRFTADKCPTLAGKPKLFFIQACQGDQLDGGDERCSQVDSSPPYRIPVHADFLIAYSTIPGFFSWSNTSRGSWFIEALCEVLKDHAFSKDMLTLLTLVNKKVAAEFKANDRGNAVQMPCITSMLTRELIFNEDNESNDTVN